MTLPKSLILAAVLTLAACSGAGVRGEAPFVQITSWELSGERLDAVLRLRNVNDEELTVQAVSLEVRAEDTLLLRVDRAVSLTIPATGFESLPLDSTVNADVIDLLRRLQGGDIANLPYVLEGTLQTAGTGTLRVRREDRIYPVPGRPGQFR